MSEAMDRVETLLRDDPEEGLDNIDLVGLACQMSTEEILAVFRRKEPTVVMFQMEAFGVLCEREDCPPTVLLELYRDYEEELADHLLSLDETLPRLGDNDLIGELFLEENREISVFFSLLGEARRRLRGSDVGILLEIFYHSLDGYPPSARELQVVRNATALLNAAMLIAEEQRSG